MDPLATHEIVARLIGTVALIAAFPFFLSLARMIGRAWSSRCIFASFAIGLPWLASEIARELGWAWWPLPMLSTRWLWAAALCFVTAGIVTAWYEARRAQQSMLDVTHQGRMAA